MTQLPDSVRQRIEKEAKAYWEASPSLDDGDDPTIEAYTAGATREAERGYKLAEAVRRYRDEPDYTDDLLYIELSAYMKSEG